ncbi:MAG: phosphoglycerate dehydrogenase [Ignavibacteriales bacterium]|nr:phosphoglycerate dehydrogenase [Ignavibacteriales bacterium]
MNILISDPVEQVCTRILEQHGHTVENKPGIKQEELLKTISSYDALIVRSGTQVTSVVIGAGKNLKVIGRAGAGVDNIDVEAASRKGIIVLNTPGGNTVSAAEHTIAMMMALARRIPQANALLREGKWDRKKFVGTELHGKTLAIIGLGKIGREVAVRCQAFGMKTIGYDPVMPAEAAAKLGIALLSLDEIWPQADFVSVHTPLNDETRHLISDAQIARCKATVRFVNCARGGIIDEEAMLRGLESGKVAGAAFDVFVNEPPGDHPLIQHPNVVTTPHLGASTEEAQETVAQMIAQQVADALVGRGLTGAVNAAALQNSYQQDVYPYLVLAERIGSLMAQIVPHNISTLNVRVQGSIVERTLDSLAAAVLKGFLSHHVLEPVNLINAKIVGEELGMSIETTTGRIDDSLAEAVAVECRWKDSSLKTIGTVHNSNSPRIVEFAGFPIEFVAHGHILLYENEDRPGVLARVSTTLAGDNLNIASLSLGRNEVGGKAITAIGIDSPPSDRIFNELAAIDGVRRAWIIRL